MLDFLLDPLSYPFMVRGLLAAVMVGVVSSLVGTHVVLRGMAFFGDSLAHAILPGVAVGYILGNGDRGVVFGWSLLAAVLTSLAIGAISRATKLREDTAIGIVFVGMFALGIALISHQRSYAVDLAHFLFGDVLGVSANDLLLTASMGGLVILILLALYKEFMVMAFDPILAATMRLPTRLLENLLLILIAVTIVVSLQTVGITLMVAMLITPAATAYLLTRRLPVMMLLAAGVAALSGFLGLYASFYVNIASGPAIVLVCTGIFLLAWLAQRIRRVSASF